LAWDAEWQFLVGQQKYQVQGMSVGQYSIYGYLPQIQLTYFVHRYQSFNSIAPKLGLDLIQFLNFHFTLALLSG